MSRPFEYYENIDSPFQKTYVSVSMLIVPFSGIIAILTCSILLAVTCLSSDKGQESKKSKESNFFSFTIKIAQLLYGEKSVKLKENSLKISGNNFELNGWSILPLVWCNINVIGVIAVAFTNFAMEIESTPICTPGIDCYNTTGYHYPNYTTPTLIDDCSLHAGSDNVKCFLVRYEIFTAFGVVGGFLLTIPRLAFRMVIYLHIKLIKKKKAYLMKISLPLFFLYLITVFSPFIRYVPGIDKAINKVLAIKSQEQIILAFLIFSMFICCPFHLMAKAYKDKKAVLGNTSTSNSSLDNLKPPSPSPSPLLSEKQGGIQEKEDKPLLPQELTKN